jgi:hypothetical protein
MNPAIILLILRFISAALLLAFLGVIVWLTYRDIRLMASAVSDPEQQHGLLRVLAEGQPNGQTYPLLPVTSIGRAASNNIVLDDGYISSQHALLTLRGRQWWLEDLGSRNGTLLNGAPLSDATVVRPGDIITVGNIQIKIEPLPDWQRTTLTNLS